MRAMNLLPEELVGTLAFVEAGPAGKSVRKEAELEELKA